jgi:hypothetical protein
MKRKRAKCVAPEWGATSPAREDRADMISNQTRQQDGSVKAFLWRSVLGTWERPIKGLKAHQHLSKARSTFPPDICA